MEAGTRFGKLVTVRPVEKPDHLKTRGKYWECLCDCGATTVALENQLNTGRRRGCNCTKGPKKEVPSYRAAHHRVTVKRGRASEHPCIRCGGSAKYWAYQHNDPNPQIETVEKNNLGMTYSLNIDCYEPMCDGCHAEFDLEHGKHNGPKKEKS